MSGSRRGRRHRRTRHRLAPAQQRLVGDAFERAAGFPRPIPHPGCGPLPWTPGGSGGFGDRIEGIRTLDGSYDVVLAADGLNSAARTALFGPRHRARYAGALRSALAVGGPLG